VKVSELELLPCSLTVTLAVPATAIKFEATAAVNCVALTKVVTSAVPFQFTVAPDRKPVPLTVSVKAVPPAVAELGLILLMTGVGGVTGKEARPEVTLPGLMTVRLAVLGVAIKLAGTAAVNCVALTKLVTSAAPFQFTVAPDTKPMPLTVSVKAVPPAVAEVGLKLVMIRLVLIWKDCDLEATLPGLITVTLAGTAVAIKLAGTAAVNCVALTKLVTSAVPFQFTVAPDKKPVPLTVSVKAAPPAVAEAGLRLVMVSEGLIWKGNELETTLPGLTTVTLALPAVAIKFAGTAAVNCVALT